MIYTSYFAKITELKYHYPNMIFISIAGKTPIEGIFRFPKLMPKYIWWSEWHNRFRDNLESSESISFYTDKFNSSVLKYLNVEKIYNEIQSFGKDVCLLCYEKPDKFCHRHIIRKWFNNNNFKCKEI